MNNIRLKSGFWITIINWSILLVTTILVYSPVGRIKGPVSVIIVPFLLLSFLTGPLSIIGVLLSVFDYRSSRLKVSLICAISNIIFLSVYAVLAYTLIERGVSV